VETVRLDPEGKTEWIIGTNLDITERHLAEAALREAKTAAEQASRAKDKFLAALSHELRTPLMPVLICAESMKEDASLPPSVREQFEMIERNIALEARLLEDLLDVTAVMQGKLKLRQESIDAHHLIQLAIGIIRDKAAAKDIHIAHELGAEQSILGTADPARIQQVIWNLLNNAVKYTPPAGRVKVRTLNRPTEDGNLCLRVEVSDTGIGIKPELLEIIFDPFEQVSSTVQHRFGGLGLGLSIARAIVQLHKGRVWAESRGPAQGSTFVVELPGAAAARPDAATGMDDTKTSSAKVPVARKNPNLHRLLLVEDHPSTLHALATLLSRSGYEVLTAETVADALALAARERFDLVVSDLGLPDGTGIQLMEELRSRHGLKGIALSGYGMEEEIARARRAGFVAHLVKPVRISELRKVLAAQ
jgi:signal transduction histidine kinase